MKIIKHKKLLMLIATVTTIIGLSLILTFRVPLGIDFTGGTLVEIKTQVIDKQSELESKIGEFYNKKFITQDSGEKQYIIRTGLLSDEDYKNFANEIQSKLSADILRHESIGGSVGSATTNNAIYALITASIFIIIYLAWAFRKVPRSVSPWAFGTIALITLIHDLILAFGIFSVIGKISGYEIDSTILVAVLTILGFSVHDTIVVFDRVRENILKLPQNSFSENAEISINQTIARSLNTSLTSIIVLVSMFILGGASIKPFVLLLALGIGVGTYSSIFIASPALAVYHEISNRKSTKK